MVDNKVKKTHKYWKKTLKFFNLRLCVIVKQGRGVYFTLEAAKICNISPISSSIQASLIMTYFMIKVGLWSLINYLEMHGRLHVHQRKRGLASQETNWGVAKTANAIACLDEILWVCVCVCVITNDESFAIHRSSVLFFFY